MKWSISLQRSLIPMFLLLQLAEHFRMSEYHEKRYNNVPKLTSVQLLIVVAKNRKRMVSITARWVVSSPYKLDIRTTNVHWRKRFQREELGSKVWMGSYWHTSTSNREFQEVKEVVYPATVYIWWIPRLKDYSWQFRHWFIRSIFWRTCHSTYDSISRFKIGSNHGQLQNSSWSGTIQCFWQYSPLILLDVCWF